MAGDTSGVTTGKATDDERLGATPSESSTQSGATLDNGATGRPTEPFHPPPPRGHPERIALRYRIERPLDGGQGGFGTVYAAFDELTRTPVVIKLLPVLSDRQLGDIRREVVSLRQARLPGLVHMLDEGVEGRHGFIVMERVAGQPFPGWEIDPLFEFEGFAPDAGGLETLADRWERLRPIALGLLEALARLHAVGLVHRDLKPANVLVDAHGVVTLLDLGLACAPDIHPEINGGTAHYAAPEQFDPFGVPSTATDLYAVGIMIYEVLTGEVPHAVGDGGWREMARRRLEVPITLPAGLPPELAATLGALLSIRARERPADAITTITALGGHPGRLLPELDLPGVSPPAALEALFHGPEHFLHLQSDAARALWHRTAGRAELVRRELAAWIRAGLTHKDGDRLRIRRDAIDRLVDGLRVDLTPPSDPVLSGEAGVTLWRLRLAWPDTWPEAVGVSAVARAELVDAGLVWDLPDGRLGLSPVVGLGDRSPEAIVFQKNFAQRLGAPAARLRHQAAALVEAVELLPDLEALVAVDDFRLAWPAVRAALSRGRGTQAQPRLLEMLVELALKQATEEEEAVALMEVQRSPSPPAELEGLLRASQALRSGALERARVLLAQLREHTGWTAEGLSNLEQNLNRMYVDRTSSLEAHERFLEDLRPWAVAGSRERQALYEGWWGLLRYRQQRFEEAAWLHGRAHTHRASQRGRLVSLRNRAAALLDGGALEQAAQDALQVMAGARVQCQPHLEAEAFWIMRSAHYRLGQADQAQVAQAEAARWVRPSIAGLIALNEAATAWRAGAPSMARTLAEQAVQAFSTQSAPHAALAEAFVGMLEGHIAWERAEALRAVARSAPPDIARQIQALIEAASRGRSISGEIRLGGRVLEVLTEQECVDWASRGECP